MEQIESIYFSLIDLEFHSLD